MLHPGAHLISGHWVGQGPVRVKLLDITLGWPSLQGMPPLIEATPVLNAEDSDRLLRDLKDVCSPEEAERRIAQAQEKLAGVFGDKTLLLEEAALILEQEGWLLQRLAQETGSGRLRRFFRRYEAWQTKVNAWRSKHPETWPEPPDNS